MRAFSLAQHKQATQLRSGLAQTSPETLPRPPVDSGVPRRRITTGAPQESGLRTLYQCGLATSELACLRRRGPAGRRRGMMRCNGKGAKDTHGTGEWRIRDRHFASLQQLEPFSFYKIPPLLNLRIKSNTGLIMVVVFFPPEVSTQRMTPKQTIHRHIR